MAHYIDKDALVAEIEKRKKHNKEWLNWCIENRTSIIAASQSIQEDKDIMSLIDTLEVKDPYEQCIQYPTVKDGIEAHAETYSFNIESELFNQLTKEQQKLWRKEIEQACISGGDAGYLLARDPRYKENLEVKEVDLEKELKNCLEKERTFIDDNREVRYYNGDSFNHIYEIEFIAKHFFELGIKAAQKRE